MKSIFNYKSSEIKLFVKEKTNWGAYFVVDDFIKNDVFRQLCYSYDNLKKNREIFSDTFKANVWRENEPKGFNFLFGGSGANI